MSQVKVCPVCGKENPINNRYCDKPGCTGNLMGVFCSESSDGASAPQNTGSNVPTGRFFKRCPNPACRQINPANANQCCACKEDLTLTPYEENNGKNENDSIDHKEEAKVPSEPLQQTHYLRSEDGFCIIPIREEDDLIIGKEGVASDYLSRKSNVSGRHIRVQHVNGTVLITDISGNGTLVNGNRIAFDKPWALVAKDLISLGAEEGSFFDPEAAYFRLFEKK